MIWVYLLFCDDNRRCPQFLFLFSNVEELWELVLNSQRQEFLNFIYLLKIPIHRWFFFPKFCVILFNMTWCLWLNSAMLWNYSCVSNFAIFIQLILQYDGKFFLLYCGKSYYYTCQVLSMVGFNVLSPSQVEHASLVLQNYIG